MKRTLSDLSQLSKSMFETMRPKADPKPDPPAASVKLSREEEEVLAYFSVPKGGGSGNKAVRAAACAPAASAVARLDAEAGDREAWKDKIRRTEAERDDLKERLARTERICADLTATLATAQKELARSKGECGRLQGELRKVETLPDADGVKDVTRTVQAEVRPKAGILTAPAAFAEVFPGELREVLLSVLSDARDAARQGMRERRAAVLDAVLAGNRPSGELERRRAKLKQIMKDAGYYTDPYALEELGFRLVSGRTHWKIEYAGVRMPIAKTPSDYRANLNMTADLANRCF